MKENVKKKSRSLPNITTENDESTKKASKPFLSFFTRKTGRSGTDTEVTAPAGLCEPVDKEGDAASGQESVGGKALIQRTSEAPSASGVEDFTTEPKHPTLTAKGVEEEECEEEEMGSKVTEPTLLRSIYGPWVDMHGDANREDSKSGEFRTSTPLKVPKRRIGNRIITDPENLFLLNNENFFKLKDFRNRQSAIVPWVGYVNDDNKTFLKFSSSLAI